jgi:hypothetical protein
MAASQPVPVITLSIDHWSCDFEATIAVFLPRGFEPGFVIVASGP